MQGSRTSLSAITTVAMPTRVEPYIGELRSTACDDIWRMSRDFSAAYPNFDEWLERSLDNAWLGTTQCVAAYWRSRAIGFVIWKPKGHHRSKICSIYVESAYRKCGVGGRLLGAVERHRSNDRAVALYLTCSDEAFVSVAPFVLAHGFCEHGYEQDRYRPGTREFFFEKCL
jgi:ribosomal protein S18 acetylase RimI-like enzyme